jgi:hypothetical protein
LLRFAAGADCAPLTDAAAAQGVPVRVVDIDDRGIASLFERALVLVRPDAHVCWRGNVLPDDCNRLVATVAGFA